MSLSDFVKGKVNIDESKELNAALAFRDKRFSQGTGKEGVDEAGAIYKPFQLNKKDNPAGDRMKYVLPIAFTRGNYLYYYLLAEQPNSKTGVQLDTLYKNLTGSAATVNALNNALSSANAQFVNMSGEFLRGEKYFKKFDLRDEGELGKYAEIEQMLYSWGSSPKPSKIIVGWKNEENPLDQKDAGTMTAKILLNLAENGKIGKTSYMVRLSNAKNGGTPVVSSVHYTTKTIGAGEDFPKEASAIQTLVANQWSGTDYTKVEGGNRICNALSGKNAASYVICVGNIVNFKGIFDTGVYKIDSGTWKKVVDIILDSVSKANESIGFELGRVLVENWRYFDWTDSWKYVKWLLSEHKAGRITEREFLQEIASWTDEYKKPKVVQECSQMMKEASEFITGCIAVLDDVENSLDEGDSYKAKLARHSEYTAKDKANLDKNDPALYTKKNENQIWDGFLNEGLMDTIRGKLTQKLGKAAQTAAWLADYRNKNQKNTAGLMAVSLVEGTLEKILDDENLNLGEIYKAIFSSDQRYAQIKQKLNGADSGLKALGPVLSEMYQKGAKLNLNRQSTDEQINKGLNLQGYVGKVADLISKSAFGKAAVEVDGTLANGGTLGGATRKGRFTDMPSDPMAGFDGNPQPAPGAQPAPQVAESEDRISKLFQ